MLFFELASIDVPGARDFEWIASRLESSMPPKGAHLVIAICSASSPAGRASPGEQGGSAVSSVLYLGSSALQAALMLLQAPGTRQAQGVGTWQACPLHRTAASRSSGYGPKLLS